MIGDGMGPEQVKAAGMYANGQPGTLFFESLPYQGEMTTHSATSAITDSAAAATAMGTGVKVGTFVVSLALPGDGSELETLLEFYKAEGKSTERSPPACGSTLRRRHSALTSPVE